MIEFGLGASGDENENVRALHTDRRTHRQKDTRTDERTTVNKLSEELILAFSSGELKPKTNPRMLCVSFGKYHKF